MKPLNKEIIERQYCRVLQSRHESVSELMERVLQNISAIEEKYGKNAREAFSKFEYIILNNLFIPSGRILNNAGSLQSQIASCFVLPIEDNFSQIFDTLKLAAECHRLGGGTGFNFSKIREKGASIRSSECTGSSGPISWMRLFNAETTTVMSGGKRRGANMGILSVNHPDILEFINCKNDYSFKNFNISVLLDNNFFLKLEQGGKIDLISPLNGQTVNLVDAETIWNSIVSQIYVNGDPGVLFLNAINDKNPIETNQLEIANPCGEQVMFSYESSFLGSINLSSLYDSEIGEFDWELFREVIFLGVRFLDNAIDANIYPGETIMNVTRSYRRLGLGVMGFADLLVKLGVEYGSTESIRVIDEIGCFFKNNSELASEELGRERGVFPKFKECKGLRERRNIAITAIAPTGTISMISNCSSGIEPRFGAWYNKNVIYENGIDYLDEELLNTVMKNSFQNENLSKKIIREGRYKQFLGEKELTVFKYAHEIDAFAHLEVLKAWQKYIDNGISKTINLPKDSSENEISDILKKAYYEGCKGITLYKLGSHPFDILRIKDETQTIQSKEKHKIQKGKKLLHSE